MTDFLSSLVDRSFGAAAAIRPRLAFLFEPALPHGEPPADAGRQSESDAASGALEREPAWPAVERRGEPAPERRLTDRPDPVEHAIRGPVVVPDPRSGVPAAPIRSAPGPQMLRAPAEEETKRPQREPAPRDSRQDEGAHVMPHDHAATAARSADNVCPAPVEMAARSKESGHDEDRGLLVPSALVARIAADLHSSVSAANVRLRDRGLESQRAAEGHHASDERNVQVTIGRIEVRATGTDKTQVRERAISPVMGLDEYLKRQARRGGQ
jgi:hypothetical protein